MILRSPMWTTKPHTVVDNCPGGGAAAAAPFWIVKHGIKMSAMPAWVKRLTTIQYGI
jgi:hypothetical protein